MRRLPAAAVIVLALVPALRLLWLSRDNPHLGFYHDDGLYWVTAKSMAEGSGYRIVSLPGEPPQTKYPPVFPALLAVAWKLSPQFPANLGAAVWLVWLAFPLMIVLSNLLMAQWNVDGRARLAMCAALALNPCLAYFGTVLMSEIWAACFLLAALFFAGRERASRWHVPLAGLCGAAAYLTKTAVAPLLIAVPLALLWHKKRAAAGTFLVTSLPPVAAWHIWSAARRAPAPDWTSLYYVDYLGFWFRDMTTAVLPAVVYRNLGELFTRGGDLLLFQVSDMAGGAYLARLVMIASLAGIVRWARGSRQLAYPAFFAGQAALLLVWNFPPNQRFLIPVLPLLLLGLWMELSHLARIARAAWRRSALSHRIAAAAVAVVLAGITAAFIGRSIAGTWSELPSLAAGRREALARTMPVYEWIARNTPPRAVFFADRDTSLYLHTGRRATAVRIPVRHFYTEDRTAILAEFSKVTEFALARRLDYLLLTPADFELDRFPEEQRRAVREAISADPRFRVVFGSPGGTVVEVTRRAD